MSKCHTTPSPRHPYHMFCPRAPQTCTSCNPKRRQRYGRVEDEEEVCKREEERADAGSRHRPNLALFSQMDFLFTENREYFKQTDLCLDPNFLASSQLHGNKSSFGSIDYTKYPYLSLFSMRDNTNIELFSNWYFNVTFVYQEFRFLRTNNVLGLLQSDNILLSGL